MPSPCGPCPASGGGWQIDTIRAPFLYGAPLDRYLQALKYRGQRRLGRALGQLLAEEIDVEKVEVDAIVCVPLHPRRLRARTFNQSDEIANAIATRFERPLLISGIRRALDTLPQTELGRKERMRNPQRAFCVRRDLRGMRIAIVDDVITTGATVNALATTLKSAGAIQVAAWSVARSVGFVPDTAYSSRKT